MTDAEIQEMADGIYREKVLRARGMEVGRKMAVGGELFGEVCGRMRAGIRDQFGEADGERVEEILRQRLRRLSLVEDVGLFEAVER